MATEEEQNKLEQGDGTTVPDKQPFAQKISPQTPDATAPTAQNDRELSEQDIFAGDDEFNELLAELGGNQPRRVRPGSRTAKFIRSIAGLVRPGRFSGIQKVLTTSIVAIVVLLLYAWHQTNHATAIEKTSGPTAQGKYSDAAIERAVQNAQKANQELSSNEPTSLKIAQQLYVQKDYTRAYKIYEALGTGRPVDDDQLLMKDFLQLMMAMCLRRDAEARGFGAEAVMTQDLDQVMALFRSVLESRSPVVRIVANYNLSLLETKMGQYLSARARAYQVIALIKALDFDNDWAGMLRSDCEFLVAETTTRYVLSLWDGDKELPDNLWVRICDQINPLVNADEEQLRRILNNGTEQLSKAAFSPQIKPVEQTVVVSPSTGAYWEVICKGASIEELIARFASHTGFQVIWTPDDAAAVAATEETAAKRRISLYMPATTPEQFVSVSAGCVGLLSQLIDKTISIFNPTYYDSLSEHRALLSKEAISLWQRFMLTFHTDERIANAHFAIGLLHAQRGEPSKAIAEYKLVASHFSKSSISPSALLHSSRLKSNLRDYAGAMEDLKQLVELYRDSKLASPACLYLADVTKAAGLVGKAGRLYQKVYNLGSSAELQIAAAFGAGKCFYEQQDYEQTVKWLTRYINTAKANGTSEAYLAYYFLGKANLALGKPQKACDFLRHVLAKQTTREDYVAAIAALVEVQMQQEDFLGVLDMLDNVRSWQISKNQLTEIKILKARVLRTMGSVDRAIAILGERAQYVSDNQLKAKVLLELAKCYATKGDLEQAHKKLSDIITWVDPGPLAQEVSLELAQVCLKLTQNSHAISICLEVLESKPSVQTKNKALDLMATAYDRQGNYDGAAMALMGRWNVVSKDQ